IGDIELRRSTDEGETEAAHEVFAVDLATVPASGAALWELPGLRAGRWEITWATPAASAGTEAEEGVDGETLARMQQGGLTYAIVATLTNPDGVSCPPPARASIPEDAVAVSTTSDGRDCFPAPALTIAV